MRKALAFRSATDCAKVEYKGVRFMKKTITVLLVFLLIFTAGLSASAAGYTVVSSPQYNMAESFESSVTKVSKNSKWALADTNGTAITGYNWEAMGDITSEYIPAKKGGKWGYITSAGAELIPYQYTTAGCFKNGVAMVQKSDGKYAYINIYGDVIFHSPFTYSFSPSEGAICGMINGLYGYSDTEGNIIIHPQFEMAFDFHEGYAAVKFGGKWGFITSYGAYSVKPAYDYASDFKNGYAVCRLNGKYGIIDTAGTRTSSFDFDYIGPPDNSNRYPAKAGTVSGFIHANGEWILKTQYDFCYQYTDGVARVYKDGKWGYIDETGTELVPPTFADCGEYHNGRAPYSLDGVLWGYLTLNVKPAETTPPAVDTPTPTVTPTPDNTTSPNTDGPTIQNPASDSTRPLTPDRENCISMKIGSKIALKGIDERTLSAPPILIDGTTMIPVRDVVELLGGSIAWNAENQRINISLNYITISMTVGSKIGYVAGIPTPMQQAPVLLNGSTLVPLRSVVDGLNCELKWIDTQQNIYIYYK